MQTATKTKAVTKTGTKTKLMVVVGLIAAAGIAAAMAPLALRIAPIVTLSAASPSGAAVPGFNEVMRFNVEAQRGDIVIDEVLFKINTTDNAATGWNTCSELDGSKFDVRDDGLNLVAPGAGWTFYNSAMTPCSGSELVAYGRAPLAMRSTVTARLNRDYQVWFDTTGASAAEDDSVRIDIANDSTSFTWTNPRGVTTSRAFRVIGNSLTF